MSDVSSICEAIGRGVLADRLGVGRQAISNAVTEGSFPASWYAIIKDECDRTGTKCPRRLFRFKMGLPVEAGQPSRIEGDAA